MTSNAITKASVHALLSANDHPNALCPTLAKHKARASCQVLGPLQEPEANACSVARTQALPIHRYHTCCLAHDLAMDDCLHTELKSFPLQTAANVAAAVEGHKDTMADSAFDPLNMHNLH